MLLTAHTTAKEEGKAYIYPGSTTLAHAEIAPHQAAQQLHRQHGGQKTRHARDRRVRVSCGTMRDTAQLRATATHRQAVVRLLRSSLFIVLVVGCCCSSSPEVAPHVEASEGAGTSAGLIRAATELLLDNYRVELEATVPSPFVDLHQVGGEKAFLCKMLVRAAAYTG